MTKRQVALCGFMRLTVGFGGGVGMRAKSQVQTLPTVGQTGRFQMMVRPVSAKYMYIWDTSTGDACNLYETKDGEPIRVRVAERYVPHTTDAK